MDEVRMMLLFNLFSRAYGPAVAMGAGLLLPFRDVMCTGT